MTTQHRRFMGYAVDTNAIGRGALIPAAVAVPLAVVLGRFVDDNSAWNVGLIAVIFVSFVAGGVVAGRGATATPALHGALSAVPCVAVLTVVRFAMALVGDTELGILVIFSQFVIGTSLGTLGGVFGTRSSKRSNSLLRD